MFRLTLGLLLVLSNLVPSIAQAWTKVATFDKGTLGLKAEGSDGFDGADGYSTFSNVQRIKGNCARISIKKGETGYGNWGGEFVFPQKVMPGGTVWFLVHTYMPAGFDHYSYGEGNRLKFMRIQTMDAKGLNAGYDDLYFDTKGEPNPFKAIYEGGGFWTNVGGKDDFPKKDDWESYEVAVTFDTKPVTEGGKALIRIWKNGVLLKEINNMKTLRDADGYASRALLFTYWNGGAPGGLTADQKDEMFMYVDEIILTNETPAGRDKQGNPYIGGIYSKRPNSVPGANLVK